MAKKKVEVVIITDEKDQRIKELEDLVKHYQQILSERRPTYPDPLAPYRYPKPRIRPDEFYRPPPYSPSRFIG
jgi:hypothetical protein